jgi:PTS system glucitol/sorbitol-specific IIC component
VTSKWAGWFAAAALILTPTLFLGIAAGIETLGFSTAELAVRYLLVGLIMNFFAGWITDFTTKVVEKQQGITLKTEVKI